MTEAVTSISIYLFLILVVLAITVIPFIIFVYLRDRSKTTYDRTKRKIRLSDIRNSYETQIAELTSRLTATEERWEELNHLILSSQRLEPINPDVIVPVSVPIFEELNISEHEIPVQADLVFALTPFSESENETYAAIKSACEVLSLSCMRSDDEYIDGNVLRHIVIHMSRARVIIANVGSRNPNVFYELGIAHALGKQTVLVGRTIEEVPFDVKANGVVLYNSAGVLKLKLQRALRDILHIPEPGNIRISPS